MLPHLKPIATGYDRLRNDEKFWAEAVENHPNSFNLHNHRCAVEALARFRKAYPEQVKLIEKIESNSYFF